MMRKEKASSGAGTPSEAMITGTEQATIHQEDCNTGTGNITRFLMHGEKNALTTATLLALTKLKNTRQLQQEIEAERKRGIPILTKPGADGGYFLPAAEPAAAIGECRRFVHFMRAKGLGCFRSLRPAKKLMAELQQQINGQQELEM